MRAGSSWAVASRGQECGLVCCGYPVVPAIWTDSPSMGLEEGLNGRGLGVLHPGNGFPCCIHHLLKHVFPNVEFSGGDNRFPNPSAACPPLPAVLIRVKDFILITRFVYGLALGG